MTTFQELEEKKQKFLRPLFSLSDKLPALLLQQSDPAIKIRIELILKHFPPALNELRDIIAQQFSSAPAELRPTLIQQETHVRAARNALLAQEPDTNFVHTCLVQVQRLSAVLSRGTLAQAA
ncbi:MAG TPA: hypothetical protein VJJ82_03435 [Candidatus Nanoarchaeia archaeon]|nr:hypothetical protein [Candidatus Nanoarchaeia archaeon]